MAADNPHLRSMLEPAVEGLGYELLGVEHMSRSGGGLLRLYIDSESGITADDCARVSHQVSGILDVENPIPGHYVLEVSSPGLERPLFKKEHYERFVGHRVRIRLNIPVEGRRNLTGVLRGIEGDTVRIDLDDGIFEFPLGSVSKARLVADL